MAKSKAQELEELESAAETAKENGDANAKELRQKVRDFRIKNGMIEGGFLPVDESGEPL